MTEAESPEGINPNAPPRVLLDASIRYVGFWQRVGASVIDGVMLGLVGQLLGAFFAQSFASMGQSGRWIGFVIAGAYFVPAHHLWGQTLAKRWLGIRVQAIDVGPVSVSHALIRYIVYAIPWFINGLFFSGTGWPWALLIAAGVLLGSVLIVGLLGNGYLLLFNRPSRRLIHDYIARTVVVRADSERVEDLQGRLAPVHGWIVAAIPLIVFGILGWLAFSSRFAPTQMAQLQSAQAALSALPGVKQASLIDQQNVAAGRRSHTVAVQLWVTDVGKLKDATLSREAVGVLFKSYPPSLVTDGIVIQTVWGFDIGITSRWRRDMAMHSVAEWKRLLS